MNSKYKNLINNFSALSLYQVSNYIFPLITFPYLVRVLGPGKYGLVNFAAAFVMYFSILTDYGFNLSAVKDISVNRENKNKINEIFSSVLLIKICLFFIGGSVFILLVLSIAKFYTDASVYIYSFSIVLGSVLFPVWFFQGIEKMEYIALINLFVKCIWAVSVFVFITSAEDYKLLILLNGFSYILIGIISLILIIFKFKVKFTLPKLSIIKNQLAGGWYIFVSTASISLYTTSNIFILGLLTNNQVVGYFSAADKIRTAVQGLFANASQAVFPYLSKLFKESYESAVKFVKKYLKVSVLLAGIFTVILFLSSNGIIILILGNEFIPSINVFRIIIFLPFIILLSNIFGVQVMLNLGYEKEFSKIILLAGIVNLILSFILIPLYMEIGTSIAVVITEIIVTTRMYLFVRKKGILTS